MTVAGGLEKTDTDAEALLRVGHQLKATSGDAMAVVSWLDYHAPPALTNAVSPSRALVGGRDLARFAEGISSSATLTSTTLLSVFGHSYGALVANEAGSRAPNAIDNLIVGGAPGVGNQEAEGVQRYSLLSSDDPIRGFHALGGETSLGLVPYDFASEANHGPWAVLSTRGYTTPEGHQTYRSSGHSEYLSDLSTSQRNIAAIFFGQTDAITR
jgi:pimeloyl-ACP methyl ester carboxylesterase